jgi:hypothetical protein
LCVIFSLIPFPYFNQSTETALTAMQITIWAVMEEHQRNGQSDLCIQLGLEKVRLANWQSPSCCFIFQRGENRIVKGTVYQWQNHIRKY